MDKHFEDSVMELDYDSVFDYPIGKSQPSTGGESSEIHTRKATLPTTTLSRCSDSIDTENIKIMNSNITKLFLKTPQKKQNGKQGYFTAEERKSVGLTKLKPDISKIDLFSCFDKWTLPNSPNREKFYKSTFLLSKFNNFDFFEKKFAPRKKRVQKHRTETVEKKVVSKPTKPENLENLGQRSTCGCRKSGCVKDYCACFHSGMPCGEHCHCTGCNNVAPSQSH